MPVDSAGNQVVGLAVGGTAVSAANLVPASTTALGTEIAFPLLTPLTIFTSTAAVQPVGRNKTIWITFPIAVTFVSGTPTVRLFGSRTSQIATTGATTGLPLSTTYLSAAIALTNAAETSIPINTVYRFSSTFASSSVGFTGGAAPVPTTGMAELDRWDGFIGLEFNWIAAPAVGTVQCYLESIG